MSKNGYIAYYRVSTTKQGDSGLGLSAQKEAVRRFIGQSNTLIDEYQEVESGKKSDRPQLLKAIDKAKETNSKLIIAKLDRLSRNASFIFTLRDSGVDFVCADMPDANTLTIGLLSVLAQEEAERTSERTKSALAVIKRKISSGEKHYSKAGKLVTRLGRPENLKPEHIEKSRLVRQQAAKENQNSKRAGAFIISLYEQGFNFNKITAKLNEAGFVTPKGKEFTPVQTKRLYERYSTN